MPDLTSSTWAELLLQVDQAVNRRDSSKTSDVDDERLWVEVRSRIERAAKRLLATWPNLSRDDTAADMTQTLLLRLQEPKLVERLRSLTTPEGYIVVALRNDILSLARRQQAEREITAELGLIDPAGGKPDLSPDSSWKAREDLQALRTAVEHLPALERRLLDMRFRQGLSIGVIATRHAMSYSAVAVRLFRVLRKLRVELSK